jgi:hypothetical protein
VEVNMPYKKTKITSGKNKGKVRVTGPGGVHAKASTPENAKKQIRLLQAIDHGFIPTKGKGKMKKGMKKKK